MVGYPSQQGFPDEDWFDYRLKLFQAVYKGKSSWYVQWLRLPKGCDDGSLAKRFSAEAVAKYVELHESFVERFKRVCDDPKGLALSLEYVRMQREFSDRRKQQGRAVQVFRDTKAEISDVCWDGKWFWAATRTGRILLLDPLEGTVKVIGAQQDGRLSPARLQRPRDLCLQWAMITTIEIVRKLLDTPVRWPSDFRWTC